MARYITVARMPSMVARTEFLTGFDTHRCAVERSSAMWVIFTWRESRSTLSSPLLNKTHPIWRHPSDTALPEPLPQNCLRYSLVFSGILQWDWQTKAQCVRPHWWQPDLKCCLVASGPPEEKFAALRPAHWWLFGTHGWRPEFPTKLESNDSWGSHPQRNHQRNSQMTQRNGRINYEDVRKKHRALSSAHM